TTAAATPTAWPATRSRSRRGSWPWPTCSTPWSRPGRTSAPGPSTRRWSTSSRTPVRCSTRPACGPCSRTAAGSTPSASGSGRCRRPRQGRVDSLRTLPAAVRARLSGRPDSEHGQALVRLVIAFLILSYLGWLRLRGQGAWIDAPLAVMAGEAVIAAAIMGAILLRPGVSHVRRWVGMVTDYATLATPMLLGGAVMAPLYVIILWVTIGNGMRYGRNYLRSASGLAAVSFLAVILFSDYWQQQPHLAAGLLIGAVAVPMYLSSLLHDLHRATAEAKRANEAKSRFLASMSHEFRSPLNGIIGMAELLRSMKLDAEQRECAEVIHTSAHSLLLLVDDV